MEQPAQQNQTTPGGTTTKPPWEPISRTTSATALGLLFLSLGPPAIIAFNAAREQPMEWLHYTGLILAIAGTAVWIFLTAGMATYVRGMKPGERSKHTTSLAIMALLTTIPTLTALLSIPQTMMPTLVTAGIALAVAAPFVTFMFARTTWSMIRTAPEPGEIPVLKPTPNETARERHRRSNIIMMCTAGPAATGLAAAAYTIIALAPSNMLLSFAISMTAFATFLVTVSTYFIITPRQVSIKRMAISLAAVGAHAGVAIGALLGTAYTTTF